MVENNLDHYFPNSKFLTAGVNVPVPKVGTLQLPIFRVVWRTIYVCIATFIAILAPFFNDIVGEFTLPQPPKLSLRSAC